MSIVIILLTMIFLINTALVTQPQVTNEIQGYANWVSPSVVAPGQTNAVLQVNLINTQSFAIYNVYITLSSPSRAFTFHTSPIYVSRWDPRSTISFQVLVDVSPNIKQGNYQVNVIASNGTYLFSGSLNVPVTGFIDFKVYSLWGTQQNTVIPYPGAVNLPLTIYIANIGNTLATNVSVYLISKYPFKFTQSRYDIGVIQSGSVASIVALTSIATNASTGEYSIPIIIHYFNQNITYNLDLNILGNTTPNVYLLNAFFGDNASPMQYGVPLTLNLFYISPSPVYLIQVIGSLPKGFSNSTGGNELVYNQPGQGNSGVLSAVFLVNIGNVSLGMYSIPFTIILHVINNGVLQEYTKNLTINIYLKGYPRIEISSPNSSLTPGLNQVLIIIKNTGYGNAYNLTITPLPSPQISLLNSTIIKIPSLRAGESKSFFISVFVPQGIQGSPLTLSFQISYISPSLSPFSITLPLGFYVSIIQSIPNLQIWGEGNLIQNQINNIKIYVKNIGNCNIYNLSLNFNSQNIAIIGKSQFLVPLLTVGNTISFNLTVFVPQNLIQGVGVLQVTAEYFLPSGAIQSTTQILSFVTIPQQTISNPISFTLSPNILTSGNLQTIKLILKNIANYSIYKISISLNTQTGFINSTLIYIPQLLPNQSYTVPLQVLIPSLTSTFFSLQIIASYYANNQNQIQQTILTLPVAGSIRFILTQVSVIQTSVNNTVIVSVTPTIVNYGTGTAIGVMATPKYPVGLIAVLNGSTYVGNIAPYTPTTFTISFIVENVSPLRPLNFTLPILLTYTDNLGRVGNQTIQIPLNITPTPTTTIRQSFPILSIYTITLIIVIVIIITLALIILRRRRK